MRRAVFLAATLALGCLSASTHATAGPLWSVGGAFGGGLYSNARFNAAEQVGAESIRSGREFGGSLRCEISRRWALELEATRMNGSAASLGSPLELPFTVHTEATAVPLNAILRFAGIGTTSFRALAGAGLLTGAGWRTSWNGVTETMETSSKTVTRPYAQAGIEAGFRPRAGFELTGRVLGRLAQANHVLAVDGTDLAIDHTGVAFALGARFGLAP